MFSWRKKKKTHRARGEGIYIHARPVPKQTGARSGQASLASRPSVVAGCATTATLQEGLATLLSVAHWLKMMRALMASKSCQGGKRERVDSQKRGWAEGETAPAPAPAPPLAPMPRTLSVMDDFFGSAPIRMATSTSSKASDGLDVTLVDRCRGAAQSSTSMATPATQNIREAECEGGVWAGRDCAAIHRAYRAQSAAWHQCPSGAG